MNRQNGDELCDLVRNHALTLEAIVNKRERNKITKMEMVDRLLKRSNMFEDALWKIKEKHWRGPRLEKDDHQN